ncbi:MAG: D-aminoacyl-tRNA deacylase [Thermoplasmata archaeon]|jgi:D-tyrosyl-tRNA(Tyr) deacylase|nr:D-aminoacyl-tRNA deacylase [Thermoplasmata archaeon]
MTTEAPAPSAASSRYLVVVSAEDPVAQGVARHWGTPPSTGDHVEGAALRVLSPEALVLRRPGLHIHDEHLDDLLPQSIRSARTTLVFPSIHRSEQNVPCLTVHPLGNPGDSAEVGGRPAALVPADPPRMVSALRALAERGGPLGLKATFEATHHGPELALPAFFVEIGYGTEPDPPEPGLRVLAETIPHLTPVVGDRVALAVGGGHYAPHFTDLALKRRWAFGHILSRHVLATLTPEVARSALESSAGAEGWLPARQEDAGHPALRGLGIRMRDSDAPTRSSDATSASGT